MQMQARHSRHVVRMCQGFFELINSLIRLCMHSVIIKIFMHAQALTAGALLEEDIGFKIRVEF
jgi:hypothetical protein